MASARGRPAPPGRPRNSQVRSTSSLSLQRQQQQQQQQDDPSRSLLSSSTTILASLNNTANHEEGENCSSMISSVTTRGLEQEYLSTSVEVGAHEIPLEDVELALRDLTRDDLVLALKRAKEQMDILDNRLEVYVERSETLGAALGDYATQITSLEDDKHSLEFALTHREERIDEMMQEQERLEQEIYRKAQVNERLRKQLDESERVRADTERRYANQSATSDKERQSYLDMEKLLQIQKAKAAAILERTQSANHQLSRQNDRLQQKVIHLQQRASPLRPRGPPGAEKAEEGMDSSGAEDDCDSVSTSDPGAQAGQSMEAEERLSIMEQELETLRNSHSALTATLQHLQTELRDTKAANADLHSQNETFVDLLHEKTINGELVTESAMLNRRYSTIGEESDMSSSEETEATETETSEADDEDDVPDVPKKSNRGKSLRRDSSVEVHNDLASELEESDPHPSGRREARHRERTRERSEMLSDNVVDLHKEIWELRDANQALTLYVNKILDRIISREGYENVLAIDGDQKRTLRGKASRLRPAPSPGASPESKTSTSPRTRLSGMGMMGLRLTNEEPLSPGSPTTPTAAKSMSAQSKARRASGMDWRSFFPSVGGIGAAATSPNPAADAGGVVGDARKIRSSEEKEDKSDEEERERIRQQLLREGIVLPEHQLRSQPQQNKRASGIGTFFSRVLGAAESTSATLSDATIVKNSEQQSDSRATTFDGHSRAAGRSPLGMGSSAAPSDAGSNSENGSLTKADLRQRALELGGGASNFTEAPARRSVLDGRRSGRRSAGDSSSSAGGAGTSSAAALSPAMSKTSDRSSRGASEAGDESYFYQSGRGDTMSSSPSASPSTHSTSKMSGGATNAEAEAPGWRKALKRMSLMNGASAVAGSSTSPLPPPPR